MYIFLYLKKKSSFDEKIKTFILLQEWELVVNQANCRILS